MKRAYSNIPPDKSTNSSDTTTKFFDRYYDKPIDIDNNTLVAVKSFFETRGFQKVSAEIIAGVIVSQSKRDNLNPIVVLDTLKGFDNIELSGLVGEVLNHNRFKSSSLGVYVPLNPPDEVQRNILA
jgi:hypothetical protein